MDKIDKTLRKHFVRGRHELRFELDTFSTTRLIREEYGSIKSVHILRCESRCSCHNFIFREEFLKLELPDQIKMPKN